MTLPLKRLHRLGHSVWAHQDQEFDSNQFDSLQFSVDSSLEDLLITTTCAILRQELFTVN